jgi:hypothetical protein
MTSVETTPGLYFSVVPRPAEPSPLRTDVAGFIGRTRRGPIGAPRRVEGWRGYLREFGGLLKDSSATYAIRGYFENGGEVAYVVRVCGENGTPAAATWKVGEVDENGRWTADSPAAFKYARYRIEASSPGAWANGTRVVIRYRLRGASGRPEVDVAVQSPGEPAESFEGLGLDALEITIESRSLLIRLKPEEPVESSPMQPGPHHLDWELTLDGGREDGPSKRDYLDAVNRLGDANPVRADEAPHLEVALVAVPGLYEDLDDLDERAEILLTLIDEAERLHDRLALVDIPTDAEDSGDAIKNVDDAIDWLTGLRGTVGSERLRAAAVYHPRLRVPDPLGGLSNPLRSIPPSGHVAGLISRLDRQRGAHHTPANEPLLEAVDVTRAFEKSEQARFYQEGINLIRCFPGRGLVVWGGRTAALQRDRLFIAHRRLIHRLIRAVRRVAEPLVFDINGPELWLTIARSITTVLLEAWRAGALKGARPEEAFRVSCNEKTTPQEDRDIGRVFCEIEIAPATPMEFILLRVALSTEGALEIFES